MTAIDPTKTREISARKHAKPLTCCRISPAGDYVFAGAEDLHVYRWSLDDPDQPAVVYAGHESWVRCMDFSPDGKTLYTAGWDGQLAWWDAAAAPRPSAADTAAPQEDGAKDAKTKEDAAAESAPAETLAVRPRRIVPAHQGFCRWVRVSPCGKLLATCGNDLLVKVWDAETAKLLAQFSGHQRHPYAVEFHPTTNHLVSEDLMGQVLRWNLETTRQDGAVDASVMTGYDTKFAADMGGARDMGFSQDGSSLACAGITNVVNAFAGVQDPLTVLIDWDSQRITHHLRQEKTVNGIAWGVRHHPDGFWIGAISQRSGKGELVFWRLDDRSSEEASEDDTEASKKSEEKSDTGRETKEDSSPPDLKPFHTLALAKGARGLDLAPDLKRLALAHADGALRIYEMTAPVAPEASEA